MPQSTYISLGSNTTVKTGAGVVYGVGVSGIANGGTVFLVDSAGLGVAPSYPAQFANSSNIAVFGTVAAATGPFGQNLWGAHFQRGLTVAATSNANFTVFWD
jgi:hypothetical protein